jgi:hypothetical protein
MKIYEILETGSDLLAKVSTDNPKAAEYADKIERTEREVEVDHTGFKTAVGDGLDQDCDVSHAELRRVEHELDLARRSYNLRQLRDYRTGKIKKPKLAFKRDDRIRAAFLKHKISRPNPPAK